MTTNHLHFTVFFDETGSVTNDVPEIFGGSLFIIENSDIEQCREFLKTYYPDGIHCKELGKNILFRVSEDVGSFLKNKNCCAVTTIQINENLIKEYQQLFQEKYHYKLTSKELSLLKRYYNYAFILRSSLFGIFNLIKNCAGTKVIINIFMENVIRNEQADRWDLHSEAFDRSLETYKIFEPFKSFFKKNKKIPNIKIVGPKSRTKNEEIMFSFSDLFAYSIRRIITHKEYNLYHKLKLVFDKFPFGCHHYSNQFKKLPNGIFIEFVQAEELDRLSELNETDWHKELKTDIKKWSI